MVLVAILFNFGLFFILNFLAPLFTGVIVGFLVVKYKHALAISFIGSLLSYCIVFVISEWLLGFVNDPVSVMIAILIMGLIGAVGGLMGALIATKARK